jgi:DNA modification methylase
MGNSARVGSPRVTPGSVPGSTAEALHRVYTYLDDVVLDPFLGSGSTAVAAVETGRRYVGYDISEDYLHTARERILAAHPHVPPLME